MLKIFELHSERGGSRPNLALVQIVERKMQCDINLFLSGVFRQKAEENACPLVPRRLCAEGFLFCPANLQ